MKQFKQVFYWPALVGGLLGACLLAASAQASTPATANKAQAALIEQSLDLRERWLGLTRNLLLEPHWAADSQQFYYKLSVDGGFMFYRDSLAGTERQPAFDHQALSQALAKASGQPVSALQLPFDRFSLTTAKQQPEKQPSQPAPAQQPAGIEFFALDALWRCDFGVQTHCQQQQRPGQPKAFGVVRDLRIAALNMPQSSPDGAYRAQVVDHNLQITDPAGTVLYQSTDGSSQQFYDPQSLRWAPDSQTLLALKVTPGEQRRVTRVLSSPTDQLQPKVIEQLYPKPGDAVDIDRPVLLRLQQGRFSASQVDNQLFSQPYQLDQWQWQPDGKRLLFRYLQRGHQLARIIAVDAATTTATALLTEQSKTFIDQWGGSYFQPLRDHGFLWLSERDGWAHLYRYDQHGKLLKQLTQGDWRVQEVLKVDEQRQQLWFAASGMDPKQDPYFIHYYRINFDGSGLTALTTAPASHSVSFAPDMQHYIDLYSRVDLPNIAELRRADGSLVRVLAQADIRALTAAGFQLPQPFVAKGRDGKTDIWGLIVRPQHFDPTKQYPVIENIYAGPHDSFVPKTFWPFGYHSGGDKVVGMQALADLGFIVVQIDGMGTGNRSKAFHDVAWQNLADSGFPDRILWHRAAAAQYPWYSLQQGVGIYGASAGGQSTVAALLFHPEFYSVGVAYAGCYDNRMDKISWNEQWLGYPVGPQYLAASVTEHAGQLRGQLLIINGEQDSNVDPASTMQLVNALIKADKDFDLLIVPGGEHTVGRSTGPIRYVQRRQFDFFLRHLKGQPTPDWNRRPPAGE